jgi:hypothetical protein
MPDEKPKAHDLTTEQAVKHLFPKEAREAIVLEAKKGRKLGADAAESSTGKDST